MLKHRLATPGPTSVPQQILLAGAQEVLHHRSAQMEELAQYVNEHLRGLFKTREPVYTLLSSGTGAMEASISNTFSAGDKVLVIKNGYFGERFAEIAAAYGLTVIELSAPWGETVSLGAIEAAARSHPDASGILVSHSETSTGVLNDVEGIGKIFRNSDTVVVVDAISSVVTHDVRMDNWGLDIVLGASHKGFMMPPGLAFISVSPKAWARIERASSPNYYFSLRRYRKFYPLAPSSPGVSLIAALKRSIELIEDEGHDNIIARHACISAATTNALSALGFVNMVEHPARRSSIITVARTPGNVDASRLLSILDNDFGVTMTGGQGPFHGKVIRFGHVGAVDVVDLYGLCGALELALERLGYPVEWGASARAISRVYGVHKAEVTC